MEPRGFWAASFKIAGLMMLPLILLIASLDYAISGFGFANAVWFGLWTGTVSASGFGLIQGFFMRAVVISLAFQERDVFLSRLSFALAQSDYYLQSHTEFIFTYKPSFQAGILAGRISVQIEGQNARILGPRVYVKKLEKELMAKSPNP